MQAFNLKHSSLVVVGGSLSGIRAVETARKRGFQGSIVLVGDEMHLPYDRPVLSKSLLDRSCQTSISHYKSLLELIDLEIDLRFGSRAVDLDTTSRCVHLHNGNSVFYDKLIVATGASARQIPGKQLPGVHSLRTYEDAVHIRDALDKNPRVVIIGGGIIGSEVASGARKRGLSVTIVEASDAPLIRVLGRRVGSACTQLHSANGTTLLCSASVVSIEGDRRVERVRLADGSAVDADLIVVGIGTVPQTDWLNNSGLTIENGLVCDEFLCAGDNVYGAGDVARWKSRFQGGLVRLETWSSASEQGTAAAINALFPNNARPYDTIPYFWSEWYGNKLQMVGLPNDDEVLFFGSFENRRCIALYTRNKRLTGAFALNYPSKIMKLRSMLLRGAEIQEAVELAEH